jgi:hypothetical protein
VKWYYLSFSTDHYLGSCVVQAKSEIGALRESARRGCNPGGEVMIIEIPDDQPPPVEARNCLLTVQDVIWYFGPVEGVRT